VVVWSLAIFLAQPAPRAQEEKFGEVTFPISCSAAAQMQLNRAVAMLRSFLFPETMKAFALGGLFRSSDIHRCSSLVRLPCVFRNRWRRSYRHTRKPEQRYFAVSSTPLKLPRTALEYRLRRTYQLVGRTTNHGRKKYQ
jgi:hypothetical protein